MESIKSEETASSLADRIRKANALLHRCMEVLNAARLGAADMDDPELLRDILVALGRKSAGE